MTIYEKNSLENNADQFWDTFVTEVTNHNRFNPVHPLPEFLKSYLSSHTQYLNKDTILYRARIIDYDKSGNNSTGIAKFIRNEEYEPFEGYDEKNSFVPPASVVSAGRANPERIVYLYVAFEAVTAIGETRPRIDDHISVAKIQLLKNICLADLTQSVRSNTDNVEEMKIQRIIRAFSRPCRDPIEYIPTQYIAEYIKSLGFDGLMFKSSFVPGGTNITIFNPNVARPIASAPYRMDGIVYRARRIPPLKDIDAFDIIVSNTKN